MGENVGMNILLLVQRNNKSCVQAKQIAAATTIFAILQLQQQQHQHIAYIFE